VKIIWQRNRFEFQEEVRYECYNIRQSLKDAGASWDNEHKTWWAPLSANLGGLREIHPTISSEAMAKYSEQESIRSANIQASRATDSDIDIPSPPGLQYLGYQKAGINFALRVFGDL
jgi:SWI/SNF-related matrix-associated actin-dependent regulator of chromatin subfamily A-like protein 1